MQLASAFAFGAVLVVLSGAARGQEQAPGEGRASSRVAMYQDDDHTTVLTSLVDGQVAVSKKIQLGAHLLVDTVSSASVDVISAASESFEETRVESGIRIAYLAPLETVLRVALVHSSENDWSSNATQLGVSRDFNQKNTEVSLGWGHVANEVGRSGDPNFSESLRSNTWEVGVKQLVTRASYVAARYTYQKSEGWHASPYRFVEAMQVGMPEVHPKLRSRHAATLIVARSLRPSTALEQSYRIYLDSWGIRSHTLASVLRFAPGEDWKFRLRARYYTQGAAAFFRRDYDTPRKYMSADRELSTFWNASLGLKIGRRIGHWVMDAKVDVIGYKFLEFLPLASRRAIVSSMGLRYAW